MTVNNPYTWGLCRLKSAVARVRHEISQAIHRFFDENGFFWVHTPIVTASDAEGAGEMFRVSTLDALQPPRDEDGQVDFTVYIALRLLVYFILVRRFQKLAR